MRIRGCVVMDTDHVQHRARRQQGRGVVRVDVVDVPVEIEMIDGAQDFRGVIQMDRFDRHRAPPHVHVRLKGVDPRIPLEAEVAIGPNHGIGWNLEFVVGNVANRNRSHLVFRHDTLRVELERNRGAVVLLGTNGKVVHIEAEARARLQHHSCVLAKDVAVFADRVLIE